MTTVAELLRNKPSNAVYSVAPSDTMLRAIQRMAEYGVGALMVMEGHSIAGIVTERDYARKIALQGRSSAVTQVAEVMTRSLHCVGPEYSSEQCMALMTTHRIRHLPVIDSHEQLLGLISIGDLVKDIMAQQKHTIEQLEHYIHGVPPVARSG